MGTCGPHRARLFHHSSLKPLERKIGKPIFFLPHTQAIFSRARVGVRVKDDMGDLGAGNEDGSRGEVHAPERRSLSRDDSRLLKGLPKKLAFNGIRPGHYHTAQHPSSHKSLNPVTSLLGRVDLRRSDLLTMLSKRWNHIPPPTTAAAAQVAECGRALDGAPTSLGAQGLRFDFTCRCLSVAQWPKV